MVFFNVCCKKISGIEEINCITLKNNTAIDLKYCIIKNEKCVASILVWSKNKSKNISM